MSVAVVIGLVLLPVAMYGLACVLAAGRGWMGVTALPRARNVIHVIRRALSPGTARHGPTCTASERRSMPPTLTTRRR
jgi:hypothetical protein